VSIRNFEIVDDLNTPAEEAYRVLRTNIQFSALDTELKTVALTSTFAGEGKTTTSVNIAISIAKDGKKVLYVDADMRKAISARDTSHRVASGLSNYLSHMVEFDDVVKETNLQNLYMVSCGIRPPNPAELLGTQRFREFLKEAAERFDMVIVDTPPLGSVIDCAIIANNTDGVIIVIKRKTVDYHKILRVKQQLEKANARILGVVLNKIDKSDYKTYYKYYDYHNSKKSKHGKKSDHSRK
jgi:capsular exopolysaccharide synthesis family protein